MYKPVERIVDHAVEIWIDLLKRPAYDNGANDPSNLMAQALAKKLTKNNTDDVLEKFGKELKYILMNSENDYGSYVHMLGVDYHPDEALKNAAAAAGLKMQFPWKTHMHLSDAYLAVSARYADGYVYHYPISDDRWLVTRLYGADIDKVIEYAEGGKPEFEIERSKK